MKPDFLLIVPEGTTYASLPAEQQAVLDSIGCAWPSAVMPGTKPINGYQIAHVLANSTLANAEQLIIFYSLDWIVIACQSYARRTLAVTAQRRLDPVIVIPYLATPATEADLRNGTVSLHRYSGHPAWTLTE